MINCLVFGIEMNLLRVLFLWSFICFQHCKGEFIDGEKLLFLRDDSGIIRVTDENYNELSNGIKDYFNVVFITTSKTNSQGVVCDVCDDFESVIRKVSLAILQQAPNAKALFFSVDVSHNKKLIEEMGLTTIPHVLIFPPPEAEGFRWSKSAFYQYTLTPENARDPLSFADYLAKILKVYIKVDEDFNYKEFLVYFVACIIVFSFFKKMVLPKIQNKSKFFCMLISFGILLPSITGYKFTQMNSIPFIARDPAGNIMYFSGGMGWQFGIEIFTVSMMYLGMTGLTVTLIYLPNTAANVQVKGVLSAVLSCALFYIFSYFISCFEIKSPGYPYAF